MGKRKKSSRKPGPKKTKQALGSVNHLFSAPLIPMDDLQIPPLHAYSAITTTQ